MTRRASYWSLVLLLAVAALPANAGDTANGLRIARSLCTNCHIVEPGGTAAELVAGVPSFMAVSAKQGQDADKMAAYILNPHPPMPQVQLTMAELADVSAYIMTLKSK